MERANQKMELIKFVEQNREILEFIREHGSKTAKAISEALLLVYEKYKRELSESRKFTHKPEDPEFLTNDNAPRT